MIDNEDFQPFGRKL
jgi:hypothetical protein